MGPSHRRAVVFRAADDPALADAVFAFRKRLFVDHCGWTLAVDDRGREIDAFDRPDAVHAAVLEGSAVRATFRAVRTDRPYLSRTVFPQLAVVTPYPSRGDAWEVSRFGVDPAGDATTLAPLAYALMFAFARGVGATSLVAVADLTYERFLRTLHIRTRRFGPPQVIGADRNGRALHGVAGEIALAHQDQGRLHALLSLLDTLEIVDASQIFGPARVSA